MRRLAPCWMTFSWWTPCKPPKSRPRRSQNNWRSANWPRAKSIPPERWERERGMRGRSRRERWCEGGRWKGCQIGLKIAPLNKAERLKTAEMRMLIAGEADKAIDTTLCVCVCSGLPPLRPEGVHPVLCTEWSGLYRSHVSVLSGRLHQPVHPEYREQPPQPQTGGEDKQPQQTPHLCCLQVWHTNSHTHTHAHIYRGVTLWLCSFWSFFTALALLCPRGWFLFKLTDACSMYFFSFQNAF